MTDTLPEWVPWLLLLAFSSMAVVCLAVEVYRRGQQEARWQQALGVRMQQEAANEDE